MTRKFAGAVAAGIALLAGVRYQLAGSWAESPVFAAGAYGSAARAMVA